CLRTAERRGDDRDRIYGIVPPVASVRRGMAIDAGLALAVLIVAQIAIVTGRELHSTPRTWFAYGLGVAMAAPVLLRRRWPRAGLYAAAAALFVFYAMGYPGFPPSLVLAVALFDVAAAGRVWWALPVPAVFLSIGIAVTMRDGWGLLDTIAAFLPEIAIA